MIGCCCNGKPCCSHRLFRTNGVGPEALNLTLESRQSWWVLDPVECNTLGGDIPRASMMHTTVLSTQELTLTKQWPVPSEVYTGLRSEEPVTVGASLGGPTDPCIGYTCDAPKGKTFLPNAFGGVNKTAPFFNPNYGWYVSESVPYGAVSGDSIWTGGLQQRTGRYFLGMLDQYSCNCNPVPGTTSLSIGRYCVFGFMFDGDVTLTGGDNCAKNAWLAFIGERSVDSDAGPVTPEKPPYTGQILDVGNIRFQYGNTSAIFTGDSDDLGKGIFLTGGGALRGVEFPANGVLGGGSGSCRPYLLETPLVYTLGGIVRDHHCSTAPHVPAPAAGIYLNPIRGAEIGLDGVCEQNTLNTAEANVPTTTPAITALSGTHACEEMLWMHATISEP